MKKNSTIISLIITFCVSAQAQTLTTFAEPGGTANPIINSLTSISADSVLVAGSFTVFNAPGGAPMVTNVNNIAVITSNGIISPLGNGISDEIVATTTTDDGILWAITNTALWQFANQTWTQMPVQVTTGNMKKCFSTK